MNLNEKLSKSIEDGLDNKGVVVETSNNFKENFFNISDEVEKNNIRTYVQAEYMDRYMFLYTLAKMLKNNEIYITFKENASKQDIDYLNRLSEGL